MRELILRAEAKAKGLKRYFTGEPCKWGHIDERVTSNRRCKECMKLQSSNNSTKNRGTDKVKERNRRYKIENLDKIKEKRRQYKAKNRDKIKEKRRQYKAENPDKLKETDRRHRAKKFSAKITAQIEAGKSLPNVLSEFEAMDIFKGNSVDTFEWDQNYVNELLQNTDDQ